MIGIPIEHIDKNYPKAALYKTKTEHGQIECSICYVFSLNYKSKKLKGTSFHPEINDAKRSSN